MNVFDKRLQELKSLYEMLERLNKKGKIANAWGGCEDDFDDTDGRCEVILKTFSIIESAKATEIRSWSKSNYSQLQGKK